MSSATRPIRWSQHAREQATRRGTTDSEVVEAIRTAPWQAADLGKRECRKTFAFHGTWHGNSYPVKEVRPIFADEAREIVVVTVYVYYR